MCLYLFFIDHNGIAVLLQLNFTSPKTTVHPLMVLYSKQLANTTMSGLDYKLASKFIQ